MAVLQQGATGKKKRAFSLRTALRKLFFFLHLWLGLFVGIYFAVVGATGSILVFREDWEARQKMPERTYVAPPSPGASFLPLSEVIAGLRTRFPGAKEAELAFMIPPPIKGGAYLWRLNDGKQTLTTTVNPYTGEVIQRVDLRHTWMAWVDELHVELLLKEPGRLANGYGALLSSVILLSGLWLWWPITLRQIKIRFSIKRGAGTPRLIADLHNVMGSYLFLLLLVVTLSGAVIVFHKTVQNQVIALFGSSRVPPPPRVVPPPGAARLPLEDLVRVAETAAPNSYFVFLIYPTQEAQPLYGYRRSLTGILPDTRIYIDPYTGKVLQIGKDIADPRSKQIMRSNASLHFGRWGGWLVKALYFVTGLLPLGLFVTGILMSIRRWRSKAASKVRRAQALPAAVRKA